MNIIALRFIHAIAATRADTANHILNAVTNVEIDIDGYVDAEAILNATEAVVNSYVDAAFDAKEDLNCFIQTNSNVDIEDNNFNYDLTDIDNSEYLEIGVDDPYDTRLDALHDAYAEVAVAEKALEKAHETVGTAFRAAHKLINEE